MTPERERDPLDGHRVPAPPTHLERRVLEAARRAMRSAPTETIWDRLWSSKPLRAAWALATAGLLIAHVSISLPDRSKSSVAESRALDRDEPAELREWLDLHAFDISPRAEARVMGRRPTPPEPELEPSNPTTKKEVPS